MAKKQIKSKRNNSCKENDSSVLPKRELPIKKSTKPVFGETLKNVSSSILQSGEKATLAKK